MSNAELTIQKPHPYPDSYYAASRNDAPAREILTDSVETDICIVGAGYAGLSTALFLVEKGYKVVMVEASHVGWGAAGRNGGHVSNGFIGGFEFLEKCLDTKDKTTIASYYQEGVNTIKDIIKRYNIDCDLKAGQLTAGYTNKHIRELESYLRQQQEYGIEGLQMFDKSDMKKHVGSDVYIGGLMDHGAAHLHPLNLTLGEAAAIESLGGKIFEQSPMTSYESQGSNVIIRTTHGQVTAKKLVLCGEAYLGDTVKTLSNRVLPTSTQMIATESLPDNLAEEILSIDSCVSDSRYVLDYYRLSADKRMLFGGGNVYGGTTPDDIITKIRPNMEKVFPQLKGLKTDYAWAGNMAITYTRNPQIGQLDSNVYYSHGFCGHGVAVTHIYGRTMAEALDENTERFDKFSKVKWMPFPGGQKLKVPYSIAGSWWYGLRDYIGV